MSKIAIGGGQGETRLPSEKRWKLVNFCEIDKYASKAYCAIHNVSPDMNLGDITQVNEKELPDCNWLTFSFPCTDLSIAGKREGLIDENGNKTHSGIYFDGLRILQEKKPKLCIIENVKNLVSKRFKPEFDQIIKDLQDAGYNVYWKVLNAKDYGVPQNRERVFIVCIRQDCDNGMFQFPEPFDNGTRLKDVLEDHVDEHFYLSDERVAKFLQSFPNAIDKVTPENDNQLDQIGYVSDTNSQGHQYILGALAKTLAANAGGLGAKMGLYLVNEGDNAGENDPKG